MEHLKTACFKWGSYECVVVTQPWLGGQLHGHNPLIHCSSQLSITDLDLDDLQLIKTASLRVRSQD